MRSGITGEIVAPADAEAIAEVLARLASDPQRCARMGAAGRIDAVQRFSLNTMVARYQALYDRHLGRTERFDPGTHPRSEEQEA